MRPPLAATRLLTRAVIGPLLSPRVPLGVRRHGLDLTGRVVPLPRGTRRATGTLGGVPATAISAVGPARHRVLYLHGGGYEVGSPASHRGLLAHLSRATGAPVIAPAYRMAPEHPHPAAVDDALAAYRALLPAGRVAVAGDSAGGGIVMSLLLRLRDAGEDMPASAGLISPWLDLARPDRPRARDAMLTASWLPVAAAHYRGGADPADLRPLEADLAGLPPLHVIAAGAEVLVDDADRLVERARAAGVRVTYRRPDGLWHAYPVLAGLLAAADEAVAELGAQLREDCLM